MRTSWMTRHLRQPLKAHVHSQVTVTFANERQCAWPTAQQSDVAMMNLLMNLARTP